MEELKFLRDADGTLTLEVPYRGRQILNHNMYNKGTAFTVSEREAFDIQGLLPVYVSTIEQQLKRSYGHITAQTSPLAQFISLMGQRSRNMVLFYRLLVDHIDEFLPIVYTPTVGEACQKFSHIYRRGRGLWITPGDRGNIRSILKNAPYKDVRLIVVTDNERILGLGDQGAGGMGISVGKLALYTVGAGIHPSHSLPISLDVGTDNQELLNDDLYVGWRAPRLRGEEYDTLVHEFIEAVQSVFPGVLLQWEDFKKANAFNLLDRYRDKLCSFNDDIQGTAGVALAGVLAATRITGIPMAQQRFVIAGAGAAGIGIARQLRDALAREGVQGSALIRAIAVTDSKGLLVDTRTFNDTYKKEFAWPEAEAQGMGFASTDRSLMRCVTLLKPTVLFGTSGQPGAFDENLVRTMAEHCPRPVIFPFSNPTSKSEATAEDLIHWTQGQALVASGSPFEDVSYQGRTIRIGQGNNVYIFPGVGLGALVSGARTITDSMFTEAAMTLAANVDPSDLEEGSLYPPLSNLRDVSAKIALSVARAAIDAGVADEISNEALRSKIKKAMWWPHYPKLIPV